MPATFAVLDQNLPRFHGGESLEERVRVLQDYQYQLLEQLRYILSHLDTRNFNMTEINNWVGTITSPIYGRIEDAEGNITQLDITAKGIAARVSDAEGNINKLNITAKSLTSQIQDAQGNISILQQTAQSLSVTVANQAGSISNLTQRADSISATVSNQAGQISNLTQTAQSISATVANQAGQISQVQQTVNGLTVTVAGPNGSSTTMINGGSIYTDNMYLDRLYGSTVYLYDANRYVAASFTLTGASSYAGQKAVLDSGAIELNAGAGDVYISAGQGGARTALQVTNRGLIQVAGNLIPSGNSIYNLGSSNFKWNDVYAVNGAVSGSDKAGKKDIDYDMSRYSGLFDRLRPCSFLRVDGTSGRRHHGFIAQEVLEALEAEKMDGKDFAGYVAWKDGETPGSGLRYEELIAMTVFEVQELKKLAAQIRKRLGI